MQSHRRRHSMKHEAPFLQRLREMRDEKLKEIRNAIPQGIGPEVVEQAGPGIAANAGGRPDVQPTQGQDQETKEQDNVAPKTPRAPAKKRVPRKKG